jgi:histidine ammonia-lyase
MGTIAARDCLRVVELTEQVAAAMLVAARQALELRQRADPRARLLDAPAGMYEQLRSRIALVEEDRALDAELLALVRDIREENWSLYAD